MGNIDQEGKKTKYKVQSVDRALQILTCFSLKKPELSLIEICDMTELPKPTVFRLLSALESAQFIERTTDKQRYSVGIRVFELGNIYLSNLSIEQILAPAMQRITREFNIACNLAILDDGQVMYIASTNTSSPFQYGPIIGYRHYIHCSALGKALVFDLADDEISAILEQRGMPALSPNTITQPAKYFENLKQSRKLGYAVDDQEGAIGIYCLAVPIRNQLGKVIAALSVSGPSPQYTEDIEKEIIQRLKDSAVEAQRQL